MRILVSFDLGKRINEGLWKTNTRIQIKKRLPGMYRAGEMWKVCWRKYGIKGNKTFNIKKKSNQVVLYKIKMKKQWK